MKRLVSLILIFLILFNAIGFYGVLVAFRYKNERSLLSHLDADRYDVAETKLIKLPLNLPYAVEPFDFERVDGQFQHQGSHYRLVKQKLANDTLYVICIEDRESKKFDQALTEYVKSFADQKPSGQPVGKTSMNFGKDYLFNSFGSLESSEGWSRDLNKTPWIFSGSPTFTSSINHPPQLS
jgi:hypothetical protein